LNKDIHDRHHEGAGRLDSAGDGRRSPGQGKTLAVMQVSGGSQSFNAVNQMRALGRWMGMLTIPNQSSVAKAFLAFDDKDRMKPSAYTTASRTSWKNW
jgi:NAD(P)H-dependent FMN reductase